MKYINDLFTYIFAFSMFYLLDHFLIYITYMMDDFELQDLVLNYSFGEIYEIADIDPMKDYETLILLYFSYSP